MALEDACGVSVPDEELAKLKTVGDIYKLHHRTRLRQNTMNEIRDLFPAGCGNAPFQLKARRDAGAVWHEPQFVECKQCGRRATRTIWARSLYVCPNCGYHMPIGGYYRLSLVLDHGSFRELDADLPPQDVLRFPGYPKS